MSTLTCTRRIAPAWDLPNSGRVPTLEHRFAVLYVAASLYVAHLVSAALALPLPPSLVCFVIHVFSPSVSFLSRHRLLPRPPLLFGRRIRHGPSLSTGVCFLFRVGGGAALRLPALLKSEKSHTSRQPNCEVPRLPGPRCPTNN